MGNKFVDEVIEPGEFSVALRKLVQWRQVVIRQIEEVFVGKQGVLRVRRGLKSGYGKLQGMNEWRGV